MANLETDTAVEGSDLAGQRTEQTLCRPVPADADRR
jgi:hypothetical protein